MKLLSFYLIFFSPFILDIGCNDSLISPVETNIQNMPDTTLDRELLCRKWKLVKTITIDHSERGANKKSIRFFQDSTKSRTWVLFKAEGICKYFDFGYYDHARKNSYNDTTLYWWDFKGYREEPEIKELMLYKSPGVVGELKRYSQRQYIIRKLDKDSLILGHSTQDMSWVDFFIIIAEK